MARGVSRRGSWSRRRADSRQPCSVPHGGPRIWPSRSSLTAHSAHPQSGRVYRRRPAPEVVARRTEAGVDQFSKESVGGTPGGYRACPRSGEVVGKPPPPATQRSADPRSNALDMRFLRLSRVHLPSQCSSQQQHRTKPERRSIERYVLQVRAAVMTSQRRRGPPASVESGLRLIGGRWTPSTRTECKHEDETSESGTIPQWSTRWSLRLRDYASPRSRLLRWEADSDRPLRQLRRYRLPQLGNARVRDSLGTPTTVCMAWSVRSRRAW